MSSRPLPPDVRTGAHVPMPVCNDAECRAAVESEITRLQAEKAALEGVAEAAKHLRDVEQRHIIAPSGTRLSDPREVDDAHVALYRALAALPPDPIPTPASDESRTTPDPTPESAVCDEPKLSCCGGTRKEPNTVQSFGKRVMCSDPCHGTGHKEA